VDPVHRSTVDRSRGYAPFLIWAVRADRTALVVRGRRAVAGGWRRRWLAGVSPAFARFRARGHGLGRGQVLRGAGGTANLSRWSGRWLRRPWRRAPQGGGAAKGGVRDAGATAWFARVKRGYEVSHLAMMLRSHKTAMEKRRWRRSKQWRRPGFMDGQRLWGRGGGAGGARGVRRSSRRALG
jgi:hypothetical protein